MQANLNLEKITTSHFQVLNGNRNMPNMIPIAYLNENFTDCNENLAGVNKNPYVFWYKRKGEKVAKTSFTFFHVVIITLKSIQY